jgi:acetyl-CoA carboxylase biotin carboxyl carrier protein
MPMYLTSEDVQDIVQLLDSLPVSELQLRTDRFELILRRAPGGGWTQATQVLAPPTVLAGPGQDAPASQDTPAGQDSGPGPARTAPPSRPGLTEVRAPLPGTFYRAPRPGSPPFVEAGSTVSDDTVVGIIETMKLMNSVFAGCHGTVAELCVANAEFAAQDTVLMRIDPA